MGFRAARDGDAVGLLGRIGAGKSPLVKAIARLTPLTPGTVHVNGCVASWLEGGMRFHRELTARPHAFPNNTAFQQRSLELLQPDQ
ncbi:MAG: ATP-binding cassette domain-containing protein [Chthoniobacteraceae bacterium]